MAIREELVLLPESVLTITCDAVSYGRYVELPLVTGSGEQYTPINIGPNQVITLGPFNVTKKYRIVSLSGDIDYNINFQGVDGVTTEAVINALSAANLDVVSPANNDEILIKDSSDSGKLKAVTVQSIIDLVAAGSGVAGTLAHTITQPAHGFSVGQVIALDSFGSYILADSSDISSSEVIGVVSAVDSSDDFTIVSRGKITGLNSLQPGETYFVSDTIPGQLVNTKPYLPDTVIKAVLIAETASSAYVMNYLGVHND